MAKPSHLPWVACFDLGQKTETNYDKFQHIQYVEGMFKKMTLGLMWINSRQRARTAGHEGATCPAPPGEDGTGPGEKRGPERKGARREMGLGGGDQAWVSTRRRIICSNSSAGTGRE